MCIIRFLFCWLVVLGLAVPARAATGDEERNVRRDATVEAVERVLPCVVNIATETIVQVQDPFEEMFGPFFAPYRRRSEPNSQLSLGSGVIIDEEGYVLTNDHVVRRADKIWIKVHEHAEPYAAKLVASNPRSDVALLKLIGKEGERFKAVQFAADDDLMLGETVLAMGNPFGLGGSVSKGILSSKSRLAPKENDPLNIPNWLQTDASINPGNSGGPLVNLRGELIGLNVAILSQAQGIGFAIPIKEVNAALSEIITPELSGKALWFGARVKANPMPLTVSSIQPGSPAETAGLKNGDAILSINGHTPNGLIDFNQNLVNSNQSDVLLKVKTGSNTHEVKVHLVPEKNFFNSEFIEKKLGIHLQELTPRLAAYFGVQQGGSFIISNVDDNSPAANVLQSGFLVTAVDGQNPVDLVDVAKILFAKKPGSKVRLDLLIQRQQGALLFKNNTAVELPVK